MAAVYSPLTSLRTFLAVLYVFISLTFKLGDLSLSLSLLNRFHVVVKLCFFTILSMYIFLEAKVYNAIPCQ